MTKKQWKKAVLAGVSLLSTGFLLGQVSSSALLDWGNKAALLAVSMQSPEGAAQVLSSKINAALTPATTTVGYVALPTTTSTTLTTVPTTAVSKPATAKGTVLTQLITGTQTVKGIAVKNRSGKVLDIAKESKISPKFSVDFKSKKPQVLILHTHTTEGYMTADTGFYTESDLSRTKDHSRNVCAAGAAIAAQLKKAGIGVIHDTTVHDNPQYTGAYTRSEATAKKILKENPSIKVVLDIHRDAIIPNDTTRVKPTATVNGKKAAQMMIIAGVVSTKSIPHPDWQENFHFALQLQKSLATAYPGLMRPLSLVGSRYNQHLAPGYLLIEMGSDVNTVTEAVYSGELLGKTLAEVLKK